MKKFNKDKISSLLQKRKKKNSKEDFFKSEEEKHKKLFGTIFKYLWVLIGVAFLLILIIAAFKVFVFSEKITKTQERFEEKNETDGFSFGTNNAFSWKDMIMENVQENKKNISSLRNDISNYSTESKKDFENIKKLISETSITTQKRIDENIQTMRNGIYSQIENAVEKGKSDLEEKFEKKIKKIKKEQSRISLDGQFMPIPKNMPKITSTKNNFVDSKEKKISIKEQEENLSKEKHKQLIEKDEDIYRSISIDSIAIDNTGYDMPHEAAVDNNSSEPPIILRQGMTNGVLVTGVSAPTFEHDKNPAAVYLTFKGKSIVSNMFEQDVENCTATGSVFGNIVTRRVEILVNKISCTYKKGNKTYMVRSNVKGWVYDGNDGRLGLPGILVDSSGAILNDSVIIGMLKGFGGFISNTAQIYASQGNTALLTTDGTPVYSPSQVAKTSIVGGVGEQLSSGFDTISGYYQRIIDSLYPYIDIKGGRKITIFFDGGETLTPVEYTPFLVNKDYSVDEDGDNNMELEVDVNEW